MPRRTIVKEFPFLEGAHEEADARLLPDGYLTAAKNVRLRKDGRFGVRADFDAIGNDTSNVADFVPYDLIGFNDGLHAVGDGAGLSGDVAPWDLASLAATSPVDWKLTHQDGTSAQIGRVSNIREFSGFVNDASAIALGDRCIDCAAAGGIVCIVAQNGSGSSAVRFFRPATGATLLDTAVGPRARVVAVGTVFFIVAFDGANDITLFKFDPASDTDLVALTSVVTGIAYSAFDVSLNHAGNGLWVAVNTTTPTTKLYPVNSSGVTGSPITGPAVLYDYVTVRETATRVNLLSVLAAGTVQLRSYTTGGTLSTGPTTIVATSDRQPGMTEATYAGTEMVGVAIEQTASPNSVFTGKVNALTHAVVNSFAWDDAFLSAKPLVVGTLNYHHLFAGVQADGTFFSHFLAIAADAGSLFNVYAYKSKFGAAKPRIDHTPQLARDASTGKIYWPNLVIDVDGNPMPIVTEFDFGGHGRRQTAQIAGLLYLAGGVIQAFDTRLLLESGFFEKPRIISATPSNGAGSLPSSATLLVAITWEFRDAIDNFWTSDISDVSTVTMGASDDTITLVCSGPHGLKQFNGTVTLKAWRSIAGVNQLREAEAAVGVGPGYTTLTLLLSDAVVRTHGVIYTQAGRGALSATLPHEAPNPGDYLWKFGSRLLAANADGAQVSKEIFPSEPVNWSGSVGFTIPKISERIVGAAALDQRGLLFTAERLYQFSGDGPNDNGEGRYSEPIPVPSSTGLMTWQSLVETPIGLFFQGSNGQLWVLPRDGSPPAWIGQPVRDTLVAFPTVTSATLVTDEQLVSFTCNNALGTDSRIVHYDLRAKTWIVDEFASATPIASATSYQGRLAILSAGVAYTERTSLTPNAFLTHGLTTGRIDLDGAGWRKFATVGFLGEYRGDCNLRIRVSYDDGKTFPDSKTFPLLASGGFSVGDTVDREWSPLRRKAEHIKLDFQALTAGSATEGLAFNKWWIAFIPERGNSRSPSAQRG